MSQKEKKIQKKKEMFINVFMFINMMLLSLCPGDASIPLPPSASHLLSNGNFVFCVNSCGPKKLKKNILGSVIFRQSILDVCTIIRTKSCQPHLIYNRQTYSVWTEWSFCEGSFRAQPNSAARRVVPPDAENSNFRDYFNADVGNVSSLGHYIRSFPWIKEKYFSLQQVSSVA